MKGRSEENRYEYIEEQINKVQEGKEKEIDNYKFHESKNISKKTSSVSVQNIVNSSSNVNTLNTNNMTGSNISFVRTGLRSGVGIGMSQEMKSTQSNEYSKIYIATKVTPIYTELASQQQLLKLSGTGSHICSICGGNFSGLGQMISITQGSMNICPVHGCSLVQK